MTRNYLNHANAFRLCTWVSNNAEACKTNEYNKLAGEAAVALGIPVTVHNMSGAINSVGIKRATKKPKHESALEQIALAILSLAEKSGFDPINRIAIEQIAGTTEQPALLLTEKAD